MRRKSIILTISSFLMMASAVFAQHPQHLFYYPIVLSMVNPTPPPVRPPVTPFSLTDPLPYDIEAYQSEEGVDIFVNDVTMPGFYQVSVFDHHLDRVYNANVLFYDGATAFISTDNWPGDTYYLQIIVPGGWFEGEFEIDW